MADEDAAVKKALNEGAINVKFKAPKTPLEAEEDLKFLVPTTKKFKEQWERWYNQEVVNNPELRTVKAQKDSENATQEIHKKFAFEFQKWLQGRSYWNLETKADGRTPATPWGTKDLFHLEGVADYVREFPRKRAEFQLKLVELYMRGPSNFQEAYLYYKYLVTAETLKSVPNLRDDLDFLDEYAIFFPDAESYEQATRQYLARLPHGTFIYNYPPSYPTQTDIANDQLNELRRQQAQAANQNGLPIAGPLMQGQVAAPANGMAAILAQPAQAPYGLPNAQPQAPPPFIPNLQPLINMNPPPPQPVPLYPLLPAVVIPQYI